MQNTPTETDLANTQWTLSNALYRGVQRNLMSQTFTLDHAGHFQIMPMREHVRLQTWERVQNLIEEEL